MNRGGFQGGEGSDGAGEWNIENVFEELDSQLEVSVLYVSVFQGFTRLLL